MGCLFLALILAPPAAGESKTYKDTVLEDQPLGYWRLSEATGSFADSAFPGGHPGQRTTYGGPGSLFYRAQPGMSSGDSGAIRSDVAASGFGLNPDGAFVSIPSPDLALDFRFRRPFTLEIWVKPQASGAGFVGGLFGDYGMCCGGSWNSGYALLLNYPSLTVSFVRAAATNGAARDVITSYPLVPDAWAHVVGTYDGQTMKLYVNSDLAAETPSTRDAHRASTPQFRIGMFDIDFGVTQYPGYLYGSMDEAAVYNRALSFDEIRTHFGAGRLGLPNEQTIGMPGGAFAENPTTSEAEPVNTATGSYWTQATDLAIPGIGLPLAFTRHYNSADASTGTLGPGWTQAYNASLQVLPNGDVVARAGDGQQLAFTKQQDGSFTGAPGARATLVKLSDSYELKLFDQTRYGFTLAGTLQSLRDRNGEGLTFAQNAEGRLGTIVDGVGRQISLTYNADGLLSEVALPDGRKVQYGYTGGRLTTVTDARGGTTTYRYDAGGRLDKITDQNNHAVVESVYGADGRVIEQINARGQHGFFGWNADNQASTYTDARGKLWKDFYSNNVLIKQVDPLGNTTRYEYDDDLNLTKVTDARGNATTLTYDARGNLLTRTAPAPLSYQEVFTYDAQNNLLSAKDGRGNTSSYEYDPAGNLVKTTEPGTIVTEYGRDPAGTGLLTSLTDPRSKITSFEYAQGNLTTVTTPLGSVTTMAYDGSGRMTNSVEPRGNVQGGNPDQYRTTYTYDNADHLLTQTDPLGNVTTWTYDPVGNLQTVTDAKNRTTTYGYDEANHLISVTAPDTTVTAYAYDPVGNLSSRTDAKLHVTTYGYDDANRLASVTTPLNQLWTYAYDGNGNRTQIVDAIGNATPAPGDGQTTLSYDALNRLTAIDYSDTTPDVGFAYDGNSNRTQMTDGSGTETYVYDPLDQLTSVTRGTNAFSYLYDPAGNVTRRTYPDNTAVNYTYDDDGRLASVTSGGETTNYGYDAAANLIRATLPAANGYEETRSYDRAGRLTEVQHAKGPAILSRYAYTLDPVGNPTQTTGTDGLTTYKYDPLDRLTEVCYAALCPGFLDPAIRWTYDAVGNRLTEARADGTTTYSYNAGDQLTGRSGLGGSVSYGYDGNGNQTQAGTRSFGYDLVNRLVSTTSGGSTTTYAYDGDGTRLRASTGSSTTNYLWDPNSALPQLALERDGSDGLLRRYLYDADLVSATTPSATSYYHHDGLGSVVNVTSASGLPQWSYSYEPFGLARSETRLDLGASEQPMRFAGEYLDPTALYHLRARQYDPATGRFLATDPMRQPPNDPYVSSYLYADNRPTVLVDPSGLDSDQPGCGSFLSLSCLSAWGKHEISSCVHSAACLATQAATWIGPGKFVRGAQAARALWRAGRAAKAVPRNVHGGLVDPDTALGGAARWLGDDYAEIAPGVFRSRDGLRQVRLTDRDIAHPTQPAHIHLEALDARGNVIENSHVYLTGG